MLLSVFFQLFTAGSTFAAAVSFDLQRPFALFGLSDPPHLPPFPFPRPEPPRPATHTIYDLIHADDRFKKLKKVIEFVGDDIISVLNDTNNHITYFAIPDYALEPPGHGDDGHGGKKHKGGKKKHKKRGVEFLSLASRQKDFYAFDLALETFVVDNTVGLIDAIDVVEGFEEGAWVTDDGDDDDDDDDDDGGDGDPDKEKLREAFRHMVKAILNYHVLPYGAYDLKSLAYNTTYPTNFKVPKLFGGHGQRISVSQQGKKKTTTFINLFSKVEAADIKADNGFIHVLNHPLLPPPAIFQELFLAQHHFSVITSSLQRTGLTDELDVRYVKNDEDEGNHLEGSTAATIFAPTNEAFQSLPMRLQLYLFSPFGQHALRKLLEYHIIPGVVAHADSLYNQTAETNPEDVSTEPPYPSLSLFKSRSERLSSVNITLNTRLVNHTVDWTSEKFKISSKKRETFENRVLVNGRRVQIPDIVALNGAIHVLDRVLCPCHHHERGSGPGEFEGIEGENNTWEDWETWLPRWAAV